MMVLLGAPIGDPTTGSLPLGPLQSIGGRCSFPFGMNQRPEVGTQQSAGQCFQHPLTGVA